MNGISVVICCYNSESRIQKTLEHLINQNTPPELLWEVILVDNCCTDNTVGLARELLTNSVNMTNWRFVLQPIPGLSYAREMGIEESQYDIILFCDDDNHLNSDYLQRVFHHFNSKPALGVLGGFATAVYDCTPPDWWFDFSTWYATGPQAMESSYLTTNKACVYGAGSAFRKSGFKQLRDIGFVSQLSDRKGKSLSSGGDIEIGNAFVLLGYEIYYDSELRLNHFIPKERISADYLLRMIRDGTTMLPVIYSYSLHLRGIRRSPIQLKSWYVFFVFLFQKVNPIISDIFNNKPGISKWILFNNHLWILKSYLFSRTTISDSFNYIATWRKIIYADTRS